MEMIIIIQPGSSDSFLKFLADEFSIQPYPEDPIIHIFLISFRYPLQQYILDSSMYRYYPFSFVLSLKVLRILYSYYILLKIYPVPGYIQNFVQSHPRIEGCYKNVFMKLSLSLINDRDKFSLRDEQRIGLRNSGGLI